ncbi:hypothetical protein LEP1GSC036_2677 [Leptospira weilii str. 2006001853]|uniref:Uncharacterized protein n=1 Tax=Leptospira weilii str. 2006001853 TaxID=1001589 RepID=A0A828Z3K4_9LEPT|nr:hypothetical protein LEP1GSC036_2677 [Leptospira weilii str. 2006001853]
MGHKKRIFVTPFFLPSLIPSNFRAKTTFFRKNKPIPQLRRLKVMKPTGTYPIFFLSSV